MFLLNFWLKFYGKSGLLFYVYTSGMICMWYDEIEIHTTYQYMFRNEYVHIVRSLQINL